MSNVIQAICSAALPKTTLDSIASALGGTVAALSEPASEALAETDELLRLWFMIEDAQDRAKVLSFVRNAVSVARPKLATE